VAAWFRSLTVVLALVLCSTSVLGIAYSVDITPVRNDILRSQTATYDVTVNNFQSTDSRFQIYTVDPSWNVKTIPVTPIIPGDGIGRFSLEVRPSGDAPLGAQGVSLTFKDLESGALIKKEVIVNLRSGIPIVGEYEPSIELNVVMPYDVDPREPVPLRLELRNRNSLDIKNLSVTISADHFGEDFILDLPPLSVRTRDVSGLLMDPRSSPGEADISIKLTYKGYVINQLEKNYQVAEYTAIRQSVDEESVFFKRTKTITVTNDGNVHNTAVVTVPTSLVKSLFVSSSEPGERSEDGELVWRIPLSPNASSVFMITENYRIIVLLLVAVVIAAIAYLFLRSPIVVLKEAVGIAKHDGVSQLKVRIFVKNRSAKLIRDLQITDRVPSIADVIKADAPGSISPSKIAVSEKKGTLLRWNMDVLEPYEERVLTYHAKSKLTIIGKMSLPQTKTQFTVNKKERVVFSNNIELVQKFKDK